MAKLKIIRASAGSGKTFTLTREYLRLALHNVDAYRHILAVTFTNKATAEMKSRLISELYRLAAGEESKYLPDFVNTFGVSEDELRKKAGIVLHNILHNYSRFYISTIDSFFQFIIRSFTREIGIQSGYTIELDTDAILVELIDRLQEETNTNKTLLNWLVYFARDKIEKGQTWNFKSDIANLGKQLFSERFKTFSQSLTKKLADKEFMKLYQQQLYAIMKSFESNMISLALRGTELIASAGFQTEDFVYGLAGPAGYLQKVARGEISQPGIRASNAAESAESWYRKDSPKKNQIEDLCNSGLVKAMKDLVEFYNNHCSEYHTAEAILKNIYALGILADLTTHLYNYCSENNVFVLSEASSFLYQVIDQNDAPFVYEKAGNHFHHFMIDEFQDTSLMQWNNFKPLISNSLSQEYDNLLVGDVKQSIYRWRNSNWEILAHDVEHEFYKQGLLFDTLKFNFRSSKNIIDFNNNFFKAASALLQQHFNQQVSEAGVEIAENLRNSIIHNFADALQHPGDNNKTGGLVRIAFIEKENYDQIVSEKLISLVDSLLKSGYKAGDIAVIARKNEEAKIITDLLLSLKNRSDGIPYMPDVISDETLFLSNSPSVRFLIGIIKYILWPDDTVNKYFILSEYVHYIAPSHEKLIPENPDLSDNYIFDIFPPSFRSLVENTGNYSLFEIIEYLIYIFRLDLLEGESVYLQALQDQVLEFTQRKSPSFADFIEFWEETGYQKSVAISGKRDAIRVLTIHKAKGLEFPVVILPYCNWDLADFKKRPLIWCQPTREPFNKLDIVPVYFNSQLALTDFRKEYFEELLKQYIDNLNLIYVAFTRAKEALYCFSELPDKDRLSTTSALLDAIIAKANDENNNANAWFNEYFNTSEHLFEIGELMLNRKDEEIAGHTELIRNKYPVIDARDHISLAFQDKIIIEPVTGKIERPVSEGRLMHEIFSRLHYADDIPKVLNAMVSEGKITHAEARILQPTLQGMFNDIQVKAWFSGEWKILTETEFILPEGTIKRPDRVLVKDDRAVVIDYKFGKEMEPSHQQQVDSYRRLLLMMGYKHVEAWLWYVILNKIVQLPLNG
jgi:ATP-dependent exoDNAse (exonuclease V) beta subunit